MSIVQLRRPAAAAEPATRPGPKPGHVILLPEARAAMTEAEVLLRELRKIFAASAAPAPMAARVETLARDLQAAAGRLARAAR